MWLIKFMLEDEIFRIGVVRLAVQKKTFSEKTEDVKHDMRACGLLSALSWEVLQTTACK